MLACHTGVLVAGVADTRVPRCVLEASEETSMAGGQLRARFSLRCLGHRRGHTRLRALLLGLGSVPHGPGQDVSNTKGPASPGAPPNRWPARRPRAPPRCKFWAV